MNGPSNIVFPMKQADGRRLYRRHGGCLCSRCHGPLGTNADGTARKDRYCKTCRAAYEKTRRALSKQRLAAKLAKLARLEAVARDET